MVSISMCVLTRKYPHYYLKLNTEKIDTILNDLFNKNAPGGVALIV